MLVDELAAAGTRRIIAVDVAGGLDVGIAPGTVLMAKTALGSDGASQHYAPGLTALPASPRLASLSPHLDMANLPVSVGAVWTTDAPYRETASLLRRAREAGASAIDMETGALYAAAAAAGIDAYSLLVIADRLLDDWQPPPDLAAVQVMLRRVAEIAVNCLQP
jgi:uridine phosphorylase